MATQPQKPQPQPVQKQAVKPKPSRVRKPFPKIDWLFASALVVILIQIGVLVLLGNSKAAYEKLKKEDADRIYVLQKATTVSQADITALDNAFLKEDAIIDFIQNLETSRSIFDTFDFRFTSDTPQGKDVKYLSFMLTAVGTKENIALFIQKLFSSDYALEVSKLDITTDEKDAIQAELTLVGNIYTRENK